MKLDLGCGRNCYKAVDKDGKEEKFTGVDSSPNEGGDVGHDLTIFPFPFEDESIDEIYSSHFLEHLDGPIRGKFMDECYRIMKTGTKMRVVHPYYRSIRSIQDFSHKWPPIGESSYLYFNKTWREANKLTYGAYDLKCNFEFTIFYTFADMSWSNKSEETRNFAMKHYNDIISDLIVDLVKV